MSHSNNHIRGIGKLMRHQDKQDQEGWPHLIGPRPVLSRFASIRQELHAHLDVTTPAKVETRDLVNEYDDTPLAEWERELLAQGVKPKLDADYQLNNLFSHDPDNSVHCRECSECAYTWATEHEDEISEPEIIEPDIDEPIEPYCYDILTWPAMIEVLGLQPGDKPIISGGHTTESVSPVGPGAMRVYAVAKLMGVDSIWVREEANNLGHFTRSASAMLPKPIIKRLADLYVSRSLLKHLHTTFGEGAHHYETECGFIVGDQYGCKVYRCECGATRGIHSRVYGCKTINQVTA
jgi:hypothetical protein